MSVPSDSILERAAAALPGVTRDFLRAELRALLTDFCLNSTAWRLWLYGLGTTDYQLDLKKVDPPPPGRIVAVIGAIRNGERWIHPNAYPTLARSAGPDPAVYQTVGPRSTLLTFWPDLSAELTGLDVHVYLAPFANGTLPEELCADFEEALLAGLKGRMMLVPKKPYTDLKLGASNMAEYRMGARRARVQARKERSTAPAPWLYPGW